MAAAPGDPTTTPTPHDFELDAFQRDAIAAIDGGQSVLVAAPTGAGKTVVAAHAVALTRQLVFRHLAGASVLDAHLAESLALRHSAHGDGREGGLAFLAKREPRFTQAAPEGFGHIFGG